MHLLLLSTCMHTQVPLCHTIIRSLLLCAPTHACIRKRSRVTQASGHCCSVHLHMHACVSAAVSHNYQFIAALCTCICMHTQVLPCHTSIRSLLLCAPAQACGRKCRRVTQVSGHCCSVH